MMALAGVTMNMTMIRAATAMTRGGWLDPILADKCDSQVRNAGEGDPVDVLDNASKQNPVH